MTATDGFVEQYPDVEQRQRQRRFAPRLAVPGARSLLQSDFAEGTSGHESSLREGLYKRALVLADAITATLLILVAVPAFTGAVRPATLAAAIPVVLLLGKVFGIYDRDPLVLNKTTLDEAPSLLQVAGVGILLLWLALDGLTAIELDASEVLLLWGSAFVLFVATRVVARRVAGALAAIERCLVVGDRAAIDAIRDKLEGGRLKAKVVATMNLEFQGQITAEELGEALRDLVRRCDAHRVIIAPGTRSGETLELIRIAKHAGVKVSVLPRVLEVVGSSVEFDHVDGLTMLAVRRFGLPRSSRVLKRTFDLVGATLLIVLFAPLMAAIAVAIKLETRGPALFRQTRVGKNSRHFQMLKFRSMRADADEQKESLRHLNEAVGLFKIKNDPRVTRIGRLLRRTSLDELPQLFNVWRGEMSLVGPRPLVVDEDVRVTGFYRHRLHLTPGMTGHWQVLGAARIPMQEMMGIDYMYVANWTLWTDVKILLRTVPHILGSRGM